VFPKSRCVQRPSSSRASQTASAVVCQTSAQRSSPVQSSSARAASSPPGAPPHHLVGVALAALENPFLERLLERRVPGDAPRDHEVAGLAAEEPGVGCWRQLEVLRFRKLRCLTRTLERPLRCRPEVDPDVGVPPAPERVQRPDDSRSSAVETG
jgi:hypothetical protein